MGISHPVLQLPPWWTWQAISNITWACIHLRHVSSDNVNNLYVLPRCKFDSYCFTVNDSRKPCSNAWYHHAGSGRTFFCLLFPSPISRVYIHVTCSSQTTISFAWILWTQSQGTPETGHIVSCYRCEENGAAWSSLLNLGWTVRSQVNEALRLTSGVDRLRTNSTVCHY